jgi:tripartite-type tricarboxylate transporter receptor subunit TctC
MAGIKMTHIPYKGMSPAITDVIAGNVDVLIASAPSIYPQVKAGRVKALGITSAAAFAPIPELRPVAQMGAPGYSFELWWGILAPKATPPDIVIQANIDVNRILETPEMKQAFAHEGAEAAPMSAAAFAATIKREIEGWKRIAGAANIQAE